jgi:hypothetical protein
MSTARVVRVARLFGAARVAGVVLHFGGARAVGVAALRAERA